MQRILVVINTDGDIQDVLGDGLEINVSYVDWREILINRNDWYSRDTLVEAENYPDHWKAVIDLESIVEVVNESGLEPPAWILSERNERLLQSLADLESL